MKCAGCNLPVTTGQLVPGPHVLLPPQGLAYDPGEMLLNEDGTPHRLTCVANNRHRAAIEHLDYCGACRLELDCLVVYDRQGQLHRCSLCGFVTYTPIHTRRAGLRQSYLR